MLSWAPGRGTGPCLIWTPTITLRRRKPSEGLASSQLHLGRCYLAPCTLSPAARACPALTPPCDFLSRKDGITPGLGQSLRARGIHGHGPHWAALRVCPCEVILAGRVLLTRCTWGLQAKAPAGLWSPGGPLFLLVALPSALFSILHWTGQPTPLPGSDLQSACTRLSRWTHRLALEAIRHSCSTQPGTHFWGLALDALHCPLFSPIHPVPVPV